MEDGNEKASNKLSVGEASGEGLLSIVGSRGSETTECKHTYRYMGERVDFNRHAHVGEEIADRERYVCQ